MNKTDEYSEMISAYADGELPDCDMRRVQELIDKDDNSSALLDVYREITASVNETAAPVPDALLAGVMSRISADDPAKKKTRRLVLTRYMPIAACLAAAVLVWSLRGSLFGMISEDSVSSSPIMQYTSLNEEQGERAAGGLSEADAPDAAAPAAAETAAAAPDDVSGTMSQDSVDSGLAESNSYDDIAPAVPEDIPPAAPGTAHSGEDGRPMPWEFTDDSHAPESTSREAQSLDDYINGASHWIIINGDLPEYLMSISPEPDFIVPGWDCVYTIPGEDIAGFIAGISEYTDKRTSVSISYEVHRNPQITGTTYATAFYNAK